MSQTRRTRKQWNAVIARQDSSGLSATQFCREFQLNYDTFCARKDAIRSGPASPQDTEAMACGLEQRPALSSTFVQVTTRPSVSDKNLTIHHDNVVLHVPLPVEPEWLVAVLQGIHS